jgi:hypothetical protein
LVDIPGGIALLEGDGEFEVGKAQKAAQKKKTQKKTTKTAPRTKAILSGKVGDKRTGRKGAEDVDEDDESESEDKVSLPSSENSSESDLEDLAQSATQQALSSVGGSASRGNKHNKAATNAALKLEADLFSAMKLFLSGTSAEEPALRRANALNLSEMVDTGQLTEFEKDLGVLPYCRLMLQILYLEMAGGKNASERSLKAEKEFNAYANGGSDPASAFEDFLKARDRFKADAGARAESLVPDDGIMGTRYLESLLTSS